MIANERIGRARKLKNQSNPIGFSCHAVILAAGVGSRLRPLTLTRPKSLLAVARQAIIDHEILAFERNKIRRICVVVGYKALMIMKHLSKRFPYPRCEISFIYNPKYEKTNTVYSLWLASSVFSEGTTFVINGDLLLTPESISKMVRCRNSCLGLHRHQCGHEEVKLRLKNEKVIDIGKGLDSMEVDGEYVGVAKFDKEVGQALHCALDDAVEKRRIHLYYDDVIQGLLRDFLIEAVDLTRSRVMEIDTAQELEEARRTFMGSRLRT